MKCSTTFVCGCMMAVCAPSWAADYTWMSSPADALWNTTSLNWNSGEAWVDGNNAIFGSSSSKTVTLGGIARRQISPLTAIRSTVPVRFRGRGR